jgi:hypothetical protein
VSFSRPKYEIMRCPNHGWVATFLEWRPCKGKPPHLAAVCSAAGCYIKFVKQDAEALKFAPLYPEWAPPQQKSRRTK